ncbi:hypothetical protein D3C85_1137090 [compost metagenome]
MPQLRVEHPALAANLGQADFLGDRNRAWRRDAGRGPQRPTDNLHIQTINHSTEETLISIVEGLLEQLTVSLCIPANLYGHWNFPTLADIAHERCTLQIGLGIRRAGVNK